MNKEKQTREPQKVSQKNALIRSFWSAQRLRFSRSGFCQFFFAMLEKCFLFKLISLHEYILTPKIMKKQFFLLPSPIVIDPQQRTQDNNLEVTYYSDCVFKPYIHKFEEKEVKVDNNRGITIFFDFLPQAVKKHPKILDNIGVLKINKSEKYGILVTKEKEGLFVSLID